MAQYCQCAHTGFYPETCQRLKHLSDLLYLAQTQPLFAVYLPHPYKLPNFPLCTGLRKRLRHCTVYGLSRLPHEQLSLVANNRQQM